MTLSAYLALSVGGSVLSGSPVYLTCELSPVQWQFAVHEEDSRIAWSVPAADRSGSVEAIFSPGTVKFRVLSGVFTIDRSSLAIEQQVEGGINKIGSCQIQSPPTRAF